MPRCPEVCGDACRADCLGADATFPRLAGALLRARKGVILTTSQFTRDATEFVERIEGMKVVLIDGVTLAELMVDHDVGVARTKVYELKEVSNDFFDEDEGIA